MSKFTIMSEFLLLSAAIFCCLSFSSVPVLGLAPAPSPTQDLSHLTIDLRVTVNAAIEKATFTLHDIKLVLKKPNSDPEERAMSDCFNSYDHVITNLKETLQPDPDFPDEYSPVNISLCLSAAITHIGNCKDSFPWYNVTRPAFIDRYDPSELIAYGMHITVEMEKIIAPTDSMVVIGDLLFMLNKTLQLDDFVYIQ